MTNKNEVEITSLYEKILHRKPDVAGLTYFLYNVKKQIMTLDDVEKCLLESDEGKAIANFSHYSDQYWNDLDTVKKYKNKLSTGNENIHWIDDIPNKFSNKLPFDNVLIVGCGNGWLERMLSDKQIGKHFDAFDISEKYILEAKNLQEKRSINYFIDDINDLQNIPEQKYDAIFNFAILHHADNLENAMKKLSFALKPNGLIFNEEYVGPSQNQYSDKQLQYMLEINSDLPNKFKTKHLLRPPLANFRVEPSEAIHSADVIRYFNKYFKTIYEKNMNGGIAYQILWNNISEFEKQDSQSQEWLRYILEKDVEFTQSGKVPVMFWYGVGKPK